MILRRVWAAAACLALIAAVTGCGGFRPLYGEGGESGPVAVELAAVAIPEPETRLGQVIRNDLLSSMRPAGTAAPDRYALALEITSQEEKTIESSTIDRVLRRTIRVNVAFALHEHGSGRVLYQGKTFSQASYDEVGQSFSDLQAKANAVERAAHEVSIDIRTRLAAHFRGGKLIPTRMGVLKPVNFVSFRRTGLDRAAGILIHGSDRGGVHERAQLIAADISANSGDPFAIVRLDEADIAADPGRLADEIQSLSLLGGRRAIWVENAGEALMKAMAPFAEARPVGNLVVAEAGALSKTSKLKALFEKGELLFSLACYEDNAGELAALIDDELGQVGLEIDPDAQEALAMLLGADRQLSRQELRKLALYCHGKKRVMLADVEAICGDVSGLSRDDVAHAAFGGDLNEASRLYHRHAAAGASASSLLWVASNHASRLMHLRVEMSRGKSAGAVARNVFFRERDALARQLGMWDDEALQSASQLLARATLDSRNFPALQDQIAERAFLSIARMALQQRRAA